LGLGLLYLWITFEGISNTITKNSWGLFFN